jgi:hypothetical protein
MICWTSETPSAQPVMPENVILVAVPSVSVIAVAGDRGAPILTPPPIPGPPTWM